MPDSVGKEVAASRNKANLRRQVAQLHEKGIPMQSLEEAVAWLDKMLELHIQPCGEPDCGECLRDTRTAVENVALAYGRLFPRPHDDVCHCSRCIKWDAARAAIKAAFGEQADDKS